jgi:hypothetical protein
MEVGLMGARDVEHIAFALGAQRVIVTHDYDFLRHHNAGMAHAGIAFSLQGAMALGPLIEALVLVHSCMTSEEIHGRVEYLSPYSG